MSWIGSLFSTLFPSIKKGGPGTPGDQIPHDTRDDETVDSATGIGQEDGQILDNTSIDPDIQDREHGFPGGTK